jgi:putative tributyrin esterase
MKKAAIILLLFIITVCGMFAQIKVSVVEDSIYSSSLKAYSKFNVILPANYYMSNERYITIYLLHGYTGDYNDWVSRTNIVKYAKDYNFIIVTPDGKNSWYINALNKKNSNYEDYLIKELIPYVGKNYRALDTRHGRAIAGLSMGGYGALRLALKYPGKFFYSASFSGAFQLPEIITRVKEDQKNEFIKDAIEKFGSESGDFWNDCNIYKLIDKANITNLPYLYISCGKDDSPDLFESNRKAVNDLQKKKALYEYHEMPGAHNWMYWDKAINDVMYKLSVFDNLKP